MTRPMSLSTRSPRRPAVPQSDGSFFAAAASAAVDCHGVSRAMGREARLLRRVGDGGVGEGPDGLEGFGGAGRTKFREMRHPVFRGVRRRGNAGRWVCEVRVPGRRGCRIWLGTFDTTEAAGRAHDAAMLAIAGAGACPRLLQPSAAQPALIGRGLPPAGRSSVELERACKVPKCQKGKLGATRPRRSRPGEERG
ncbi:dehydration-responsive element-binding protein 1A-like [Panicum miliaceum]|uniref:Dehydration-responsive element-binding protein 1A-like n=1 Tax=Panicum miliaceum TaxID=4540 RepID=A0A3L6T6X7_PANMI|nr:dehydration-responsive element-binding protein 1A-like [Panicum miliaceum]